MKKIFDERIIIVKKAISKLEKGCKIKLLGSMVCGGIVNQNGIITENVYRCMSCKEQINNFECELSTLEYCKAKLLYELKESSGNQNYTKEKEVKNGKQTRRD